MTPQEQFILKMQYVHKSDCKAWTDLVPFKPESLPLLQELKSRYPIVIYEKMLKFRLMIKL